MSVQADPLTILRETKFFLDKKLGEGTSGTVVLAHTRITPVIIQVKSQFQSQFQSQSQQQQQSPQSQLQQQLFAHRAIKIFPAKCSRYFLKEKNALEKLKECENVVQMDKAIVGTCQCYIIMEECNGDVFELITAKGGRLTEDEARVFFSQMAKGLIAAHAHGICHHDVKLENFLMGKDGEVKLSDFGFAISMDDKDFTQKVNGVSTIKGQYSAGSPAYSSPQVLRRQAHSPISFDIYGLGISLYRMICGYFPFCDPEKDSMETLKRNVAASADPKNIKFPPFVSREARELILGMIAVEEKDRWDWKRVVNSAWATAVSLEDLMSKSFELKAEQVTLLKSGSFGMVNN